jgi:hypothetical protein
MKTTVLISLLGGWVLFCAPLFTKAQEFSEHITKEFTVGKTGNNSVLSVYNIQGSIKVEGYSGDKVVIEVDKTISAKSQDMLETGKKEFRLAFEQKGDSITAYIADPQDSRPRKSWRDGSDREVKYRFALEFVIKVPMNMSLNLSTINKGVITVDQVNGPLHLRNINGSISLNKIKGVTDARTVNGDISADYLSSPSDASTYATINGQIKVIYPANLSADLRLKSMRGAFYTDFENLSVLPAEVSKSTEKTDKGTLYKMNKNSDMRIGSGGKLFKFETLNGDIILKKQS